MKIVLTGGPGSGKTTLLEHLRTLGHPVVEEAAMRTIEQLAREMGIETQKEWRRTHVVEFQQRILQHQIEQEDLSREPPSGWCFLDRGRLDGLGYMRLAGVSPPPEMMAQLAAGQYRWVFTLETLPGFQSREETGRLTESREDSSLIRRTIANLYREKGYRVVDVPVLPLPERAAWLFRHLEEKEETAPR
jgi:predicted ATPase